MTRKIRPNLSEEQQLSISDHAEEIGEDAAVKEFKKTHTVRNRRWVERRQKVSEKTEQVKETPALPVPENDEKVKEYAVEGTYIPMGVTSFAQLKTEQAAEEVADNVKELTEQYTQLLWNIMYSSETGDKIAGVKTLSAEFATELEKVLNETPSVESEPLPEGVVEGAFKESFGSSAVLIEDNEKSDVLYLDIQVIEPGWGNTRDNHYYPREMLKAHSDVFLGAKMYETDHKPNEKSTRTWVSTVKEITGFTETGAPVARVAIHDSNFAQRIRNLNEADLLSKMECSIMAAGRAKKGFELDGRKGSVVESITDVAAVDWVTSAGAGGKALSLAESEEGMKDEKKDTKPTEDKKTDTKPAEAKTEKPADVNISEQEQEAEEEVTAISGEIVESVLAATNLPDASKKRLSEGQYDTKDTLNTVIAAEIDYVKELIGSGKPKNLSESNEPKPVSAEEIGKLKDEVNLKHLR